MFAFRPKIGAALAFAIFAFGSAGVNYLDIVFTSNTRWLCLLPMLLMLLAHGRLWNGLRGAVGVLVCVFLFLAVASTLWSAVPQLSGLKSIAYAFSAIGFSAAGAYWALKCPPGQVFRVFIPVLALVLFAVIGGLSVEAASVQQNELINLYRGLTANSNFLAILALGALPFALWKFYRPNRNFWGRFIGLALAPTIGVILLYTFSRASILAAVVMVISFLLGLGLKRYALAGSSALLLAASLMFAFPDTYAGFETQYIYKGQVGERSILSSREDAWKVSSDGADAGGLIGLGFGVSDGYTNFEVGLAASDYGREKGNTTLAVIEELGVAGLVVYIALLTLLFSALFRGIRRSRRRDERVVLSIVLGALAGLVINSQFEAWFLSPGAFGMTLFWTLLGVGLALVDRFDRERCV